MSSLATNMEEIIIKGFKNLNYDDFDQANFKEAIVSTSVTSYFIRLVCWLTQQLQSVSSCITQTLSGEEDTFSLELIGLLRDLECPYASIIGGNGLQTVRGKLFTLDYLISELEAARMCCIKMGSDNKELMETDVSNVSGPISTMAKILNVPIGSNISSLIDNLQTKISEKVQELPGGNLPPPLLKKPLNQEQWVKVNLINDAMCQEYKQRRQVLMKRVDVTIQSFCWSQKLKTSAEKVSKAFHPFRSEMRADSITSAVDILAARTDLYPVEKTSSGESREATKCEINRILIPKVPDRGGRPSKTAPPVEMPKFVKRVADPPRGGWGGGRGGGRGGSAGGRYQDDRNNDNGGYGNRGRDGSGWRGKQGGGRGRGRGGRYDDYGSRPSGDNKMYYS